jgi:ribosomal protein S5
MVKAALDALYGIKSFEEIAARRGVSVERLTEHMNTKAG